MLPDQPFAPETVEEQLADLKERLQFQQLPEHTRNLRLIQDLQQLYPAHAAEPATLERTRLHLLQRLEERTLQPNGPSSPLQNNLLASQESPRRVTFRSRRKMRRSALLVALIGVVLGGFILLPSLYSAFFSARPGIISGSLTHPSPSTVASGLARHIAPQPVFYQGKIYVNIGGEIHTYSAQTGVPGRAYALANPREWSFTIVDGILYESGVDATSATRISDGKLLWQAPFGSSGSLDAQEIVNGALYVVSEGVEKNKINESIYALRASDGKLLWRYRLKNANEFADGSVVVLQGVLYFTSSVGLDQPVDERISALKATDGALLWSHTLGHTSTPSSRTDGISPPSTNGSLLYVYVNSSVKALQPGSGNVIWQTPPSEDRVTPVITSGIVYNVIGDTVYALQAARGTILWRYKPSTNGQIALFSAEGSVLALGIFADVPAGNQAVSSVVGLRTSDGHLLWQSTVHVYRTETPSLTVGPDAVYVVISRGFPHADLSALSAKDGTVLWQQKVS